MPTRRASGQAIVITQGQATNEKVSVVRVPIASQHDAVGNVDVMTNLGSYGRKLYGLALFGNQR